MISMKHSVKSSPQPRQVDASVSEWDGDCVLWWHTCGCCVLGICTYGAPAVENSNTCIRNSHPALLTETWGLREL